MLLYELDGQDRSRDLLRAADDYRRLALLSAAEQSRRTPLAAIRLSTGRALTGLGKRIAGAA